MANAVSTVSTSGEGHFGCLGCSMCFCFGCFVECLACRLAGAGVTRGEGCAALGAVLARNQIGAGDPHRTWTSPRLAIGSSSYRDCLDLDERAAVTRFKGALYADGAADPMTGAIYESRNSKVRYEMDMKKNGVSVKIIMAFDGQRFQVTANGVDLEKTQATLGAFLKMDPKRERFTNHKKANSLLTRDYRKPFLVPEKV